jgi:hypothetical protein
MVQISIMRPSGLTDVDQNSDKLKDKSGMVRLTIDVELSQHTKLRIFAARNRKTLAEVMRELIAGLPD